MSLAKISIISFDLFLRNGEKLDHFQVIIIVSAIVDDKIICIPGKFCNWYVIVAIF